MPAVIEPDAPTVIVVGAGFSGLYAIHRLRAIGIEPRVFEAGDDIGGTWHWNRYPGARCDVGSLDYSYSFSPDLDQEWDWSEKYATQPEILRYIHHVADRFDLRRSITLNTRVIRAEWDSTDNDWIVSTDDGEAHRARFLLLAPGALSKPNAPNFPGIDRFGGPIYHTAAWPREGVDFTGQSVGVIGTGSSGIQTIPLIAEQARALTVFQRTPVYAMPAGNRALSPEERAAHKAHYPELREGNRHAGFGVVAPDPAPSALAADAGERDALYDERWHAGWLTGLVTAYADILTDRGANETLAEFVRDKIRATVADPRTADLLCPTTFPIGTKRPCLATGYYETFNAPHVSLVDLRATPITAIAEGGIETGDRDYPLDAIVFATGFDAVSGAFQAIDIRGRDGVSLADTWRDGPRSYLGIAVAGFPNMFTVTGPGSPSVFSNMVVSIEQHIDWIADYLHYLWAHGQDVTAASVAAQDDWVRHVAEVGEMTLYPQADSWYMGSNIAGKARTLLAYLGGVGAYRAICDDIKARGYPGFESANIGQQAATAATQNGDLD